MASCFLGWLSSHLHHLSLAHALADRDLKSRSKVSMSYMIGGHVWYVEGKIQCWRCLIQDIAHGIARCSYVMESSHLIDIASMAIHGSADRAVQVRLRREGNKGSSLYKVALRSTEFVEHPSSLLFFCFQELKNPILYRLPQSTS